MDNNIKMELKDVGCAPDSSGSGQGPVANSCDHGNESSSSINDEEILD
jgi:hypothetical protein